MLGWSGLTIISWWSGLKLSAFVISNYGLCAPIAVRASIGVKQGISDLNSPSRPQHSRKAITFSLELPNPLTNKNPMFNFQRDTSCGSTCGKNPSVYWK